jgi:hypothetical protein
MYQKDVRLLALCFFIYIPLEILLVCNKIDMRCKWDHQQNPVEAKKSITFAETKK